MIEARRASTLLSRKNPRAHSLTKAPLGWSSSSPRLTTGFPEDPAAGFVSVSRLLDFRDSVSVAARVGLRDPVWFDRIQLPTLPFGGLFRSLMRAGTPTMVVLSATSVRIVLFGIMTTLLPIFMSPTTFAPGPKYTLSPTARVLSLITTPVWTVQLAPILIRPMKIP